MSYLSQGDAMAKVNGGVKYFDVYQPFSRTRSLLYRQYLCQDGCNVGMFIAASGSFINGDGQPVSDIPAGAVIAVIY